MPKTADETRLEQIEAELKELTAPLKHERDQIRNRIRVRRHRSQMRDQNK